MTFNISCNETIMNVHVQGIPPSHLWPITAMAAWWLACLLDWLMDWSTDGLIDWLSEWVSDWWHIACSIDWSIDWLINCLNDWLTDWLVDWLSKWLTDWLVDWTSWVLNPFLAELSGYPALSAALQSTALQSIHSSCTWGVTRVHVAPSVKHNPRVLQPVQSKKTSLSFENQWRARFSLSEQTYTSKLR